MTDGAIHLGIQQMMIQAQSDIFAYLTCITIMSVDGQKFGANSATFAAYLLQLPCGLFKFLR